jgi:hypothetical protein
VVEVALEFPDFGQDLGGAREMRVRPYATAGIERCALVRRVGVGVDEDNGERFGPEGDELQGDAPHLLGVDRLADRPVGQHALADFEAEVASTTGVKSPRRPQVLGRSRRRISRTSRKPRVVMRPTRAPLRSRSALVPTVVPCTMEASASTGPKLRRPAMNLRPRRRDSRGP